MRVILLKSVPKVGKSEDIVEVNEGFARNALFPKKLATPATPSALAELSRVQSSRAAEKAVHRELLDQAIATLSGKAVVYKVPANEQGSLFSKIDAGEIADYLFSNHRISIDKKCISIPGDTIKKIGTYTLVVKDGLYTATLALEVQKK